MQIRKINIIVILSLLGIILGLSSLFLPWWSYREYELNALAPFATQSLHILPAQYVIESQQLIVYRLIPLNHTNVQLSNFITIFLIIAVLLGMFSLYTIYRLNERKLGEIMFIISSLMYFLCPIIFQFIIDGVKDPWLMQISDNRGIHFLPYGFETAWGLSYGYYFAFMGGILMIINKAVSKYFNDN